MEGSNEKVDGGGASLIDCSWCTMYWETQICTCVQAMEVDLVKDHSVWTMSHRELVVAFLELLDPSESQNAVSQYTLVNQPLPVAYRWLNDEKEVVLKFDLSRLYSCLRTETQVLLVSVGTKRAMSMGKSSLLKRVSVHAPNLCSRPLRVHFELSLVFHCRCSLAMQKLVHWNVLPISASRGCCISALLTCFWILVVAERFI